jgi:arylsulfatase
VPEGGAKGVMLTQGGRFGGWSFYLKEGKPEFTYNFLGLERYVISSPNALPKGKSTVKVDFVYDGDGLGKGGKAVIYVDSKEVANGRIEKTQPYIFSADETADVGLDNQTPVAEGIGYGPAETKFTGKIDKVFVEIK